MKRIVKLDKISIDITDEDGQKVLYNHLREEYGVSENQVLVDEDERIWLTNKVGEKFAMIGKLVYN
jgi:hypothetical protein